MKISAIFLACLLFFTTGITAMDAKGISQNYSMQVEDNNKPNCWVNEVRHKIIQKYTKKYDLDASVLSDSMPGGIIHRTGVGFTIHKPISKEKARQILVECTQEYIQEINNKKELRPYLENYPITPKNIDVSLLIYDTDGERTFYPNLGYATLLLGSIEYRTCDPKDRYHHKTVEKETFEEAVKKVKEEIPKEDSI